MKYNGLNIIATHLNVSSKHKVSEEEVFLALKHGTLNKIKNKKSNAMISFIFCEFSPDFLIECAYLNGSNIETINNLYNEIISENGFIIPKWEKAVEFNLNKLMVIS